MSGSQHVIHQSPLHFFVNWAVCAIIVVTLSTLRHTRKVASDNKALSLPTSANI